MRILKEPTERKNEILDAARDLFFSKGYENTTVNDILKQVGIAKGTFYYYFESKERVMEAIITRSTQSLNDYASGIADDPSLSVPEKLMRIFTMGFPEAEQKQRMVMEFHRNGNAEFHQRSLVQTVLALSPSLEQIVKQGISQGIFSTPYPRECVESLLISTQFLFDEGLFHWKPEELPRKIEAQIFLMEKTLGAQEGSLRFIARLFHF